MSDNNENKNNDNSKDNGKIQQRPPLPRHEVTSKVSEVFELINSDKNKKD
jgi:hypothetical protein